jgi:aldehyde:ferredoxin oxidoreductase
MTDQRKKILNIDLTSGTTNVKNLKPELTKAFIGDCGVAFRLAYDLIKPGTDPISPENPIIFAVGPLSGTRVQAPRWSVVTKYPLGGCIAFGNSGMGFGIRLKRTGYDYMVITGSAPKPVYIKIYDDDIEICDASDLWGKDNFETSDTLWERIGKEYSLVTIGPAGENLVRISLALVDKMASLGKGGLAAIMGAKNVKAIAVRGTKRVKVAHQERFDRVCDEVLGIYKANPELERWRQLGKIWFDHTGAPRVAYRNSREIFPRDRYRRLYGTEVYLRDIKGKRAGCMSCQYPCKDVATVKKGDYKGLTTNVSSMVGRVKNMGVHAAGGCSFEQAVKLVDSANRYGIDTHQFGPLMMLVMELHERGIITTKDAEGLKMVPSFETALSLLEKVAFRQGIGDIIADGTPGIINRFDKECERYSSHVKGHEVQIDARSQDFSTCAFSQVTNPEGGGMEPGHAFAFAYPSKKGYCIDMVKEYCQHLGLLPEAVSRILDKTPGFYNVPRLTKYAEDFHILLTAMSICEYRTEYLNYPLIAELFSSVTGIEMTAGDIQLAGERIWNLFKLLNAREGFDRKDDRFPSRWLESWNESGKVEPVKTCTGDPVSMETFNHWIDDYYDERGWDIEKGVPTKDKLRALGLPVL